MFNPIVKDTLVAIKKTLPRFISILLMIALGVLIIIGLTITGPIMRETINKRADDLNMPDISVSSSFALVEEDGFAIEKSDYVESVYYGHRLDVTIGEKGPLILLEELDNSISYEVVQGRLPEKPGEVALDEKLFSGENFTYRIGDRIDLSNGPLEDTHEFLNEREFTLVGFVRSPEYIADAFRGRSVHGKKTYDGFGLIPTESFNMDTYGIARVYVKGADGLDLTTKEYKDLVDEAKADIENKLDLRPDLRLAEIRAEAGKKLDDSQTEIQDAYKELDDVERELADAREELDEAYLDYEDGKKTFDQEIAKARTELYDAKLKLANGKKELDQGEIDYKKGLEDFNKEISATEDQIAKAEKTLNEGKKELDQARADYQKGLSSFKEEISDGQSKLDQAKAELDEAKVNLDQARAELDQGQGEYQESLKTFSQEISMAEEGIKAGEEEIIQGERDLAKARAEMDRSYYEIRQGERQITKGWSDLRVGEKELEKNTPAIQAGEARLQEARDGLIQAKADFEQKKSQTEALIADLEKNKNNNLSDIEEFENQRNAIDSNPDLSEEEKLAKKESIDGAITELEEVNLDLVTGIKEAKAGLDQGQAQIKAGEDQLRQAEASFEEQSRDYYKAKAQINSSRSSLRAAEQEIRAGRKALAQGEEDYRQGLKDIEKAKTSLEEGKSRLEEQKLKGQEELNNAKKLLDQGEKDYQEGLEKYQAGLEKYEDNLALFKEEKAKGEKELAEAEAKLDQGQKDYDEGLKKINEARATLQREKVSGQKKLEDARSDLDQARKDYQEGLLDYQEGLATFEKERTVGRQELQDAYNEILDGEEEYQDGLKEFEKERDEALLDLQEGQEKIDKGRSDLAKLSAPSYGVKTAPSNEGFYAYEDNSRRLDLLAFIFPTFFFFISMLVTLNAIARMVDEDRSHIGTLKSLGYKPKDIAVKYRLYTLIPTFLGCILGLILAYNLIAPTIFNAYNSSGFNVGEAIVGFYPGRILLAFTLSFALVILVTELTMRRSMEESPSSLLRPKAPKAGSRIFLERISPLWSRLNFFHKVTARNLFRYLPRSLMTIFGVAGCTALVFMGFALQDSIEGISPKHYGEILKYDLISIYDPESDDLDDYLELTNSRLIKDKTEVAYDLVTAESQGMNSQSVEIIAVKDELDFKKFVTLRDRQGGKTLGLNRGPVLSEKLASLMNLEVGDQIVFENMDQEEITIPIQGITESYIGHSIYMSAGDYEKIYGKKFEENAHIYILRDKDNSTQLINEFTEENATMSVISMTGSGMEVDELLQALDVVVVILSLISSVLAIVVLYNLTNINIAERIRELSTIKVLGFYPKELTQYIYRETFVLSIFGVLFGFVLGRLLHYFIITALSPDNVMMLHSVQLGTYIKSSLVSLVISLVIMMVMHRKLKNIDMVEAMKDIE